MAQMPNDVTAPSAEAIKHTVRLWREKTHLRLTVLRRAVVSVMEQVSSPISAETVYRQMTAQGQELSLATTYRILKELEADGLLGRTMYHDALGARSLYAVRTGQQRPRHCFFECDICHTRRPLSAPALIDQLINAASHDGFQVQRELVVLMRCSSCETR